MTFRPLTVFRPSWLALLLALSVLPAVVLASPARALVGPEGDNWHLSVSPYDLECTATSNVYGSAWNHSPFFGGTGWCGTFLEVNGRQFGTDVSNQGFQYASGYPEAYWNGSQSAYGNGFKTVVDAGDTNVRVTQTDVYNTRGDGWETTIKVTNLGDQTRHIYLSHVTCDCLGSGRTSVVYNEAAFETSSVNWLKTVTHRNGETSGGSLRLWPGYNHSWGYNIILDVDPGQSIELSDEIVWRKDGTIPAPDPGRVARLRLRRPPDHRGRGQPGPELRSVSLRRPSEHRLR